MTVTASWELDREHEDFRASVRAFVDRHVRPVVDESEVAGRPPAALLKEMGSAGLLGLAGPEEFGGGGVTRSPSSCCPRSWPGPAAASP
jgi:alkylation response protein AidB-like acyl-CoA dehydrogenase